MLFRSGALVFRLSPICAYWVEQDEKSYGLLCFAEIETLGGLPDSEIELIRFFDDGPDNLTYPLIQPDLFEKVKLWLPRR